jgi:teichuronic acid biosynthesis glycosyltransferase TuaG
MQSPAEPLVSVVMPAYNCASLIDKAIQSVLEQEVPLELLVIDDRGKEPLEPVLAKYAGDARVRFIQNERNMGVAKSRNRGVSLARGKYIAFLDADDWWERGKLALQIETLERTGVALCSTAREIVTPEGKQTGKIISVKEQIGFRTMLFNNEISCSSVVVRAEIAREFPMERDEMHEDYITWLKILKKYGRAIGINQPLLKYRLSANSKSGNKFKSARMTYNCYRYMGFGHLRSAFYFVCYAFNGVRKYS